jgi:uncharacterized membrane protein YGL010W
MLTHCMAMTTEGERGVCECEVPARNTNNFKAHSFFLPFIVEAFAPFFLSLASLWMDVAVTMINAFVVVGILLFSVFYSSMFFCCMD